MLSFHFYMSQLKNRTREDGGSPALVTESAPPFVLAPPLNVPLLLALLRNTPASVGVSEAGRTKAVALSLSAQSTRCHVNLVATGISLSQLHIVVATTCYISPKWLIQWLKPFST